MPLHPPRVAGKTACASRTGRGPQAAITFSFIRTLSTAAVRSGRLRPFCLARRGAPGVIIMTTRMLIDARHRGETRVAVTTGNRIEEVEFESAEHKQIKGHIYHVEINRASPSQPARSEEHKN